MMTRCFHKLGCFFPRFANWATNGLFLLLAAQLVNRPYIRWLSSMKYTLVHFKAAYHSLDATRLIPSQRIPAQRLPHVSHVAEDLRL